MAANPTWSSRRVNEVKIPSARAWALLGAATYTVVFHGAYVMVIAPTFAYDGSFYAPVSPMELWVAGAAATLPSLWLPSHIARPSQVALWLMYLVGYVPGSLVMYYVQQRDLSELWPFTVALLAGMTILGVMDRLPRASWVVPYKSTISSFSSFVVITALLTIGYIALTVGISFDLPDVSAVYDTRASFGDAVSDTGALLVYVVAWSANVVGPLLIALSLRRRRPALLVLGVFLELVIYGITGFKTALFSTVLVVGLVGLLWARPRPSAAWLAWVTAALVVAVSVFDRLNGSIVATSIFVRRVLEVPALVTSRYFEFFGDNPTYSLAHSFLRTWVSPPSQLSPPELIGSVYFGSTIWANGGLWADGFANFGFAGMLLFATILGGIFWLLDVVADRTDLAITGSVVGVLGVIMTNTALFTTLLTHGLGLAIVAFALLPRHEGVKVALPVERGVRSCPAADRSTPPM